MAYPLSGGTNWQPSADGATLRRRATALAQVRDFFAVRGVLEVDPPVLARSASTDPALQCFVTHTNHQPRYLHTSPEFFMKRLLAAGSGPIYALGKAFREGEYGRWHNPEFSLLEWYRPGFSLLALMQEVVALVQALAPTVPTAIPEILTYQAAFQRTLGLDPHQADTATLQATTAAQGIVWTGPALTRRGYLDLLLTHCIEPHLGQGRLTLLTEYPADQAALARIRPGPIPVAERFELYWQGLELANGFHELSDPTEQAQRFASEQYQRQVAGLAPAPADEFLLAALAAGLPDCCGVALGFDRLLALALGAENLASVLSFAWERC